MDKVDAYLNFTRVILIRFDWWHVLIELFHSVILGSVAEQRLEIEESLVAVGPLPLDNVLQLTACLANWRQRRHIFGYKRNALRFDLCGSWGLRDLYLRWGCGFLEGHI